MRDSSSAFQYIRIVRMVRFFFVLRQLWVLTAGSGGAGSLIPGLRIPPRLANMLNVAYSSLVLVSFFACLWWVVRSGVWFAGQMAHGAGGQPLGPAHAQHAPSNAPRQAPQPAAIRLPMPYAPACLPALELQELHRSQRGPGRHLAQPHCRPGAPILS